MPNRLAGGREIPGAQAIPRSLAFKYSAEGTVASAEAALDDGIRLPKYTAGTIVGTDRAVGLPVKPISRVRSPMTIPGQLIGADGAVRGPRDWK